MPRTLSRRGGMKKLRTAGRVPAVIYGRQRQPQVLDLGAKDVENMILHSASENILVNLEVEGDAQGGHLALVQEIQHHPLSGQVLHLDLHEVSEQEKVTISVPVESVGEAIGVKGGGILEHVLFKIKVRAFLKDLPDIITVDVSHLEIGQAIHIGDIKAPPDVEILGDKRISVIAVAAPIAEVEEAAPAAGEALAEPEVIREKKEEGAEEGEGGAKAAPGKAAAPAKAAASEKTAGKEPEKKK
ncbi:MAG TPA: 50S ribosomal protein L25 [Candidatus Paceibacterota bacterium]|nr:50S ribosomal protein L25 [Candidatus Paceibacterota bacterium]HSA02370.1 50S ribosomal protein L25 [Candidatus Paceibacterota bacterium]